MLDVATFYKMDGGLIESAAMGISIKHDEYERLIRQLAARRGTSITDAIGQAVKRELERDQDAQRDDFVARVREAQAAIAALPVLDPRPYREILYDEDGLPR